MKVQAIDIDFTTRNTLPKSRGYRVVYGCPTCQNTLSQWIPYKEYKYCNHCGESLFWGGCIKFINTKLSSILDMYRKDTERDLTLASMISSVCEVVNYENECDIENTEMVYMEEVE